MIKILHVGDIHIHNTKRHDEYREQFEKLYELTKNSNIDIITIVGDLFETKITLSNEAKLLAAELINNLSQYCKEVVIVKGNHDLLFKSLNRTNSIETITKLIDNPKVTYLDKTDFYQDKYFNDIVWVNWNHIEKDVNPWDSCSYTNDPKKIYIDLFHDPVYECKDDGGRSYIKPSYRKTSDFLGTISMYGDIHKQQVLAENKAYCGSLIQQNFGELPKNHGGIIWTIKSVNDIKYDFFDIPNDYSFVNVYLDEPKDYDNLDIKIEDPSKYIDCKVHWKDYAANINLIDNEIKIKEYLKEKYNIEKVKFNKQYLYTSITESEQFTDSIDITNIEVQQSIMREYFTNNGYDEKVIDELIKIDDIINSRIEKVEYKTNITWSIEKIWFNNFKSYGDNNVIEWSNKNGIIQLMGKNQEGKTTILDLITYVLYGTTLATNKLGGGKVEKHGDNRYINNKRNVDYCDGGMIINADGEIYTLYRRSERSWKRNKEIKGVSTQFDVYEGSEMVEDKKMTKERKAQTQEKIARIIGEFEDFIRLALTNADNLNELLSLNRATFLDNVLKDAGFDVFEDKNEILKEYKKEIDKIKIFLDIDETTEKISILKEENITKDNYIKEISNEVAELNKKIKELNKEKDSNYKKLHNIDESLSTIDINEIGSAIEKHKDNITSSKLKFNENLGEIKTLKTDFDEVELEDYYTNKKQLEDEQNNEILSIAKIDNKISDHKHNVDNYKSNIEQLKKDSIQENLNKISEIRYKISEQENEIKTIWKAKETQLREIYKDVETEFSLKELELKNIKEKGVEIKKEIEKIKTSSVCPTCNREYDNIEDLKKHIELKTNNLNQLFEKVKPIQEVIKKINVKKHEIEQKLNSVVLKDISVFPEIYGEIETIENKICKFNENISKLEKFNESIKLEEYSPELEDKIADELEKIKVELTNIKDLEYSKKGHHVNIENIKNEIIDIDNKIIELEEVKNEVKKYNYLKDENERIKLQLENYKIQIESLNSKIELYNVQLKWIEENKKIEEIIEELNENIDENDEKVDNLNSTITEYKQNVEYNKKEIDSLVLDINKFKEQERKNELIKEYGKAIHREGIPSYLLLKSIYLINNELISLLTEVDFNVFFDDNLNLKLSPKERIDVIQNAIESSGKERTFIACSLKLALRNVNNKSKPNFILFDEITGKLYENSVEEFFNFLNTAKNKIEKIIIIEHVHPIDYDYLISVEKDKNGVSSLSMS